LKNVRAQYFSKTPDWPGLQLTWPTRNHQLFNHPDNFFARTRANPEYGKPGWTRELGKRFHFGCDIAPVAPTPTGKTTEVIFTDATTGNEYSSFEPTWHCDEEVFAIAAGEVVETEIDPDLSTYGIHLIIRHAVNDDCFYSLYAHLRSVCVSTGHRVRAGDIIGRMGQTSSSADARNWMAIAPHLHLEIHDRDGHPVDPVEMLKIHLNR